MKNSKQILKNSKNPNKTEVIVFTNGVFDLLHPGHIHLLKMARSFGDKLIVGLNSDNSARRLNKGAGRPINPVICRKKILESIRYVDRVVIFDEETPERLIKEIKPDILVKGSGYQKEDVVGAEFVESYGGEVKIISNLGRFSDTNLIRKIQQLNSPLQS